MIFVLEIESKAGSKTKIIDEQDLQSKVYDGWIKSYENPNQTIQRINLTIAELFNKKNKNQEKNMKEI